jgi:hypothetical protein
VVAPSDGRGMRYDQKGVYADRWGQWYFKVFRSVRTRSPAGGSSSESSTRGS